MPDLPKSFTRSNIPRRESRRQASGGLGARFAALALAVLATAAGAAEPRPGPGETGSSAPGALVDELRAGGFVIYLRHTATVHDAGGVQAEDLGRCDTQRNLSALGRAEAERIGRAIRALAIPVGRVAASPYCRARETAQLAFGRYQEDRDLSFVVSADAGETRRLAQSLRRQLATPPAPGTNSVIVSHSANLFEAAGIFAKPEGAAYVFRPLGDGNFEAVARLLPEDWENAGKGKSAGPASGKVAARDERQR